MKRLRSVKRFFLLDQGDFLNQFIDLADEELKMPVSHITQSRLEALLELSIRTSAADKDPYKDDLRIVLSPTDLITQLMRIISIDTHNEQSVRRKWYTISKKFANLNRHVTKFDEVFLVHFINNRKLIINGKDFAAIRF